MTKVLKVIPLLLALVLLASVPAVISAETMSGGGASRITAQQGPPSVSISASANVQVRLNSPVPVTATFSEPVSGFTLDDITVGNGVASGLSGSDGDAVYTFAVTPDSLGEVTVDIPAGVATDGEGSDNTPAPRLSLGIPYDFDGSGGISISGVFAAIDDYFAGKITIAQTIAVIRLYFSTPTEPEPGPGPSDDCIQTVSSDGMLDGQWSSGCDSEERSGSHARYYRFTLNASSEVTVTLESGAANTYLYLRQGDATSGTALYENDDHQGSTSISQIQETLAAGAYTIEATTLGPGETGSFTLTVAFAVPAPKPQEIPSPRDFPWVQDGLTSDENSALSYLEVLHRDYPAIAQFVLNYPWVADSITEDERRVLAHIWNMAGVDSEITESIVRMQFLGNSITSLTVNTVSSMRSLVRYHGDRYDDLAAQPWFQDDLTDEEIEKVGRDPFLIAYAIGGAPERCVVTNERSRPGRTRANRHLPDVSRQLRVRCINAFDLIQELDFRKN